MQSKIMHALMPWRAAATVEEAVILGLAWRLPRLLLALALLLALGLSGCSDMAAHGNRILYGIDCRPEAMRNGRCATRGAQL